MTPEDCHNLEDYIAFFRAIPEERWCEIRWRGPDDRRCAQGLLGCTSRRDTPSYRRLKALGVTDLEEVNDGVAPGYSQPTPKQRVLAYLEDVLNGRAE